MSDTGGDIIIKGGSVELEFDGTLYSKQDENPKLRKNAEYKITQVIITGGGMEYTSDVFPQGSNCVIKIVCKR